MSAGTDRRGALRVVVRHNLVAAIERVDAAAEAIPTTRLDVSAMLARNHLENGCLDGDYLFDDPERARSFAVLCLDFVRRLAEHASAAIEDHDLHAGGDWRPPR